MNNSQIRVPSLVRIKPGALPRLGTTTLDNLLYAAHQVDGIVKGLKQPDWPLDSWQALQRLALDLCRACAAPSAKTPGAPVRARILA